MVDPNAAPVGDFPEASAEATVPEGVYRVVGTPERALVCLRVTDADGRRANTGEVVRVDADDAQRLDPATEPRGSAVSALLDVVSAPYWLVRSVLPF